MRKKIFYLLLLTGLYACQPDNESTPTAGVLSTVATNIEMGDQGSAYVSFFASATYDGYESLEISTLSSTAKQAIDITFASINSDRTPALVSPSARATTSTTSGNLNNPMGANATATVFKEEVNGPSDLNAVTATQVNAISGTNAVTVQAIQTNRTYSFINAKGKKGFIRVKAIGDLDGQGDTGREVRFDIVVQK